jgi:hypothetical protein
MSAKVENAAMENSGSSKPTQARKPYRRPVIRYYGAIQSITKNIGFMSMIADGSMVMNMTKTL